MRTVSDGFTSIETSLLRGRTIMRYMNKCRWLMLQTNATQR